SARTRSLTAGVSLAGERGLSPALTAIALYVITYGRLPIAAPPRCRPVPLRASPRAAARRQSRSAARRRPDGRGLLGRPPLRLQSPWPVARGPSPVRHTQDPRPSVVRA